jgi:hypothetical protein
MPRAHFASILTAIALAGCATVPQMTREEALAVTSRVYPGITVTQSLEAAERVLQLADGADFSFAHQPNGFVGMRRWLTYFVLGAVHGTDHWQVTAEQVGPDVRLRVFVSTSSQDITPMAVTPAVWVPMTMPANAKMVAGTAIYDVFFARVDYLLGIRPAWMSCKEADGRVSAGRATGDNSALCNGFNMADATPTQPLIGPK